jgi:hypothetical protein
VRTNLLNNALEVLLGLTRDSIYYQGVAYKMLLAGINPIFC